MTTNEQTENSGLEWTPPPYAVAIQFDASCNICLTVCGTLETVIADLQFCKDNDRHWDFIDATNGARGLILNSHLTNICGLFPINKTVPRKQLALPN